MRAISPGQTIPWVRHRSHPDREQRSLTCCMTPFEQFDWLRLTNWLNIMVEYQFKLCTASVIEALYVTWYHTRPLHTEVWLTTPFWLFLEAGIVEYAQTAPLLLCLSLFPLQWRHNEHECVSNHKRFECLLKRLFRPRSKKHRSSASVAFAWGIHRRPVNSPHKRSVTRKMFPFDDVIIYRYEWGYIIASNPWNIHSLSNCASKALQTWQLPNPP